LQSIQSNRNLNYSFIVLVWDSHLMYDY